MIVLFVIIRFKKGILPRKWAKKISPIETPIFFTDKQIQKKILENLDIVRKIETFIPQSAEDNGV